MFEKFIHSDDIDALRETERGKWKKDGRIDAYG